MMHKMKNKTYRNFMIVKNRLMTDKGYGDKESSEITHHIFENFLNDGAGRSVEWFYNQILSKAEYDAQCCEI